jgi:hypothetical protein
MLNFKFKTFFKNIRILLYIILFKKYSTLIKIFLYKLKLIVNNLI